MLNSLAEKAERHGGIVFASLAAATLRHAQWLGALLILLFTATAALTAIYFPLITWDIIAYVAAAMEKAVPDPVLLHKNVWEVIETGIPAGDFLVLTQDRPYRVAQYTDPASFYSMLGFYRVKWLYIEIVALIAQSMSPLAAIHLVSALSAAGIGLIVFLWLYLADRLEWAPLAVASLLIAGFGDVARIGTPDGMASLFLLAGVLAYWKRNEPLTAIALFAAFLSRPDHLAFIGVFMVATLGLRQMSWGVIAAFVAAAIAYVPITTAAGHPGWWVQFWFTNVEYVPTIEGFDPDFSAVVYLKAAVQTVVRALIEESWVGLMIACLVGWAAMTCNGIDLDKRGRTLLIALILTIAAKFVLLPLHENRFHFAYVMAMALVLLSSLPKPGIKRTAAVPISSTDYKI